MNWLDIVLLLILGLSVVAGWVKGFARVGIGLAAAVLGVLLGTWFYPNAGALFEPYLKSKGLANLAGFVSIVIACLIVGGLVAALVARLLKWAGLSWLDRLAGAAFGFLRGVVIGIALVMAALAFSQTKPARAVVESRCSPYFIEAARVLAEVAPRELREAVQESYQKAKEVWKQVEKGTRKLPSEAL